MERRGLHGVYFIYKSMEIGTTFRSIEPKYPTQDPGYRFLRRERSRYCHFYFYIRDEVLGAITLCVASFLPFNINCWLNGHNYIEGCLRRLGVRFRPSAGGPREALGHHRSLCRLPSRSHERFRSAKICARWRPTV